MVRAKPANGSGRGLSWIQRGIVDVGDEHTFAQVEICAGREDFSDIEGWETEWAGR